MATSTLSANAILFAINSAIRLGTRFRKVYAKKLQAKAIILPLPSFNSHANETRIAFFFESKGHRFLEFPETERLKNLHEKAKKARLSKEELDEYREYYDVFFDLTQVDGQSETIITQEDALQILHLKQWQNDRILNHSALQLVAGSIIEIGIDYFHQIPGALNTHSAHGKAIKHFLSALDNIDFAEGDNLKKSITRQLAPRLFAAAAETVNDLSAEIVGDEQLQNLIQAATKGIVHDIYGKIGPSMLRQEREEIIDWGQLILRSMIKNAGEYAFTNTQDLFGTSSAASELVAKTGSALLDAILSDEAGINLKEVFSSDTLDEVLLEAFNTLAEYPQLVSRQEGIKKIVVDVSNAMITSGFGRHGLAPEFIRLILEKAALNAQFFWKDTPSGAENILIMALQQTLTILSHKENPNDTWRLSISNSQVLDIVYKVTDEIIMHPEWVVPSGDDKPSVLSIVLSTSLDALSSVPQQQRFSQDTFGFLLELSLRTVAKSHHVLDLVKWGGGDREVIILDKALNLIFDFVYNSPQTPGGTRLALLTDLLDYGLDTVLRAHPNKKGLLLIQLLLFKDAGIDYSAGFSHTMADQLIDSAISVLDEHTELVIQDDFLVKIISETANALRSTVIEREQLLPELVRLLLDNSAGHLDMLVNFNEDDPKHLLVIGLKQILQAIALRPTTGKWKPSLTNQQLLDIVDIVFSEILIHPVWTQKQGKLIFDVLHAVFIALETIPNHQKLPYIVIRSLIEESFKATSIKKELALPIETEPGVKHKLAIEYSLESFFVVLYDENNNETASWNLTQADVINALANYFLMAVSETKADKQSIDNQLKKFKSALDLYKQNLISTIEELLLSLESKQDIA